VRFAVYGDVRGERARHRNVVAAVRKERPDLVVFTGDALGCRPVGHVPDLGLWTYLVPFWPQYQRGYPLVMLTSVVPFPAAVHELLGRAFAPPRDPDGYNGFLEDTAPLRLEDRIPYVFVPGNHDLYHRFDRLEGARLFALEGGAGVGGPTYGSLDVAGHRLLTLDTGTDLLGDADPIATGSPQLTWLEARLRDADARGLRSIVALHSPPYSSGDAEEPSPAVRERIGAILDRHDVALVLGGHAHAYERIVRAGRAGRPVTHVVTGGGGAPFHEEAPPAAREPGSQVVVEGTTHFVVLELDRAGLRGRMIPVEGPGPGDEFVVAYE
jgi:3',5'-cyclic AMP phosphodiesterase CpdA